MRIPGYLNHFVRIAGGYAIFQEVVHSQRHSSFRTGRTDIRGLGYAAAALDGLLREKTFAQPRRKGQDISTGTQSNKAGQRQGKLLLLLHTMLRSYCRVMPPASGSGAWLKESDIDDDDLVRGRGPAKW